MKAKNTVVASSVLVVIICVLLIFNFARSMISPDQFITFESLFQVLSGLEGIPLIPLNSLTITADWGILNGLRDFFNIFTGLFTYGIWFATSAINAVLFIFRILIFAFGNGA